MSRNHYTLTKLILADLVQVEASDRFGSNKLTKRHVNAPTMIRQFHAAGDTSADLARRFGVTTRAINMCVSRQTYHTHA